MISRFIFSVVLLLIVISGPIYAGSIDFSKELVYVIPGFDQPHEAHFADIDFDGVPEILVRRYDHILAYSITEDSVLFETDIEAVAYRKILFADINRDSIADIAIAYFHDYPDHSDSALVIDVFDGADNYLPTRRYYPNAERLDDLWLVYSASLASFKALDVNRDGYNELLISYCNWIWNGGAGPPPYIWTEYQYEFSKLYFSYPDSQLWESPLRLDSPQMIHHLDESFLMSNALLDYSYRFFEEARYYSVSSVARFDEIMNYTSFFARVDSSGFLALKCAGDLISDNDSPEFLSEMHYPVVQRMYRMPTPDSAELVWTREDIALSDYVFLPDYPGTYFAFSDDRFIQFNGDDGSEFQSTYLFPGGSRKWDYPFNDDQPYLVTFNSNTVAVYKPAIVTDVDGEEDRPIPTTFSMGQPYPNPFNATQTIPITTKPGKSLTVDIYNLLGQKIERIYNGVSYSEKMNITWNADKFASGIYLIRAQSGDQTAVVRSILLK